MKRSLFLLLLLGLLGALFEMNQWLPGSWPGSGGEGGLRERGGTAQDPDRVRAPQEAVPPGERGPTHLLVLRSGGAAASAARLAPGAEAEPTTSAGEDGRADLSGHTGLLRAEGLRVVTAEGEVRHGPLHDERPPWVVHLPDPMPPTAPEAGAVSVRVEGLEPGASAWILELAPSPRRRAEVRDGRAVLPDLAGATLVVLADPQGRHRSDLLWVHPRGEREVTLTAHRGPHVPGPTFVDAQGRVVSSLRLRPLGADGRPLDGWTSHRGIEGAVAAARLPTGPHAFLEVAFGEAGAGGERRPSVVVPREQGGEVRVPDGRRIEVRAVAEEGRPLGGVRLHARHEALFAAEGAPGEAFEVETEGTRGAVAVPRDRPARVRVEVEGRAPAVLVVGAGAEDVVREVTMRRGVALGVDVQAADGRPLEGAHVLAVTEVEGLLVLREARTGAAGRARVHDLPPGPLDLYVTHERHAGALRAVDLGPRPQPQTVRLEPGHVLRLKVEDPLGLPLEGVHVVLEPDLPVIPPTARPLRTDVHGLLVVAGLDARPRTVRLSKQGYRPARLETLGPSSDALHLVTLLRAR